MYDPTDGGRRLRLFTSNTLAYWHTYKHCVKLIWSKFANTVWAPLWHQLYPNSFFYIDSTPMPAMVMHMMYMLHSWPKFKGTLVTALATENLNNRAKVLLEDIQFMCTWAIPQVRPCFKIPTQLILILLTSLIFFSDS